MKRIHLSLLISLVLSACSLSGTNPNVDSRAKIESPQVYFATPDVLRSYSAFYLAPIKIYEEDQGRIAPAAASELRLLEHDFQSKIVKALGSHHTQFNQPQKGVAIIEVQVLNIWSGRLIDALRPGVLIPNNLGAGATMQADFYDSVSNKKIATVWDSRAGERTGFFSGLGKWSGTKGAFDEWARLLAQSIRPQAY